MIEYLKSTVRIAELHYDEPASAPIRADVVRYQWRFEKAPGTFSFPQHTSIIDLRDDPDKLLGQMQSTTRKEVRRAYSDPLAVEFHANPGAATVAGFFGFYDEFAKAKKLPDANRARLDGMRRRGSLSLSRVANLENTTLAWHCYFRSRGWARLLLSASAYRLQHSKKEEPQLGRANRHLHWRDMLAMRDLGDTTYDFGGWYAGSENAALININRFKEAFGGRVVELHNTYDGLTIKGRLAVGLHRWKGGE